MSILTADSSNTGYTADQSTTGYTADDALRTVEAQFKVLLRGSLKTIQLDIDQSSSVAIPTLDCNGVAIDMTGRTLRLLVEDYRGADVAVIADGGITRGTGEVSFALTAAMTSKRRTLRYSLLDITGGGLIELAAGYFPVY